MENEKGIFYIESSSHPHVTMKITLFHFYGLFLWGDCWEHPAVLRDYCSVFGNYSWRCSGTMQCLKLNLGLLCANCSCPVNILKRRIYTGDGDGVEIACLGTTNNNTVHHRISIKKCNGNDPLKKKNVFQKSICCLYSWFCFFATLYSFLLFDLDFTILSLICFIIRLCAFHLNDTYYIN